jgi:lipoate-protein ligase B
LNLKLIEISLKTSVRTAKKTQLFTVTEINLLTLFKEIITVGPENSTKHKNTFYGQNKDVLIIKGGGACSYHGAFRG